MTSNPSNAVLRQSSFRRIAGIGFLLSCMLTFFAFTFAGQIPFVTLLCTLTSAVSLLLWLMATFISRASRRAYAVSLFSSLVVFVATLPAWIGGGSLAVRVLGFESWLVVGSAVFSSLIGFVMVFYDRGLRSKLQHYYLTSGRLDVKNGLFTSAPENSSIQKDNKPQTTFHYVKELRWLIALVPGVVYILNNTVQQRGVLEATILLIGAVTFSLLASYISTTALVVRKIELNNT